MPNPYITNVDPYFSQQDLSGYAPIMQDDSRQKAMQAAALAQQNQQVSEAGQTQQGGGMSGLNPLAMAMMLRKKKPGTGEMVDANGNIVKDETYGAGNAYSNMTSDEINNMMANGL